jgi:hypothetical protein
MENNNNKPVQVVLTYNPNNAAGKNLHAKIVSVQQDENKAADKKIETTQLIVRRYSFDDNGGGYRGL